MSERDDAPLSAFSHLAVAVTDLGRSARFYERAFGFRRAARSYVGTGPRLERVMELPGAHVDGLFLRHGGFLLELLAYRSSDPDARVPHAPDAIGFAHLSFVVDDIDSAFVRVGEAGGTVRPESRMSTAFGGGEPVAMAFVTDPDGNRIELIEHRDDRARRTHGRFLGADTLGWPPAVSGDHR